MFLKPVIPLSLRSFGTSVSSFIVITIGIIASVFAIYLMCGYGFWIISDPLNIID